MSLSGASTCHENEILQNIYCSSQLKNNTYGEERDIIWLTDDENLENVNIRIPPDSTDWDLSWHFTNSQQFSEAEECISSCNASKVSSIGSINSDIGKYSPDDSNRLSFCDFEGKILY